MLSDNPYQTPNNEGSTADNARLHRRAKRLLQIAVGCVVGGGLSLGYSYWRIFYPDIISKSTDGVSPSELANDIVNHYFSIVILPYIGLSLVILGLLGGVIALPLWFLTKGKKPLGKDG
jgi:hypothetical protein